MSVGVRQSRRVWGDYILVEDDLKSSRHFCDYQACNTLRLIIPCMVTGQAAGVAAAIAAQDRCVPRQVSIKKLRKALMVQDVYLGQIEGMMVQVCKDAAF